MVAQSLRGGRLPRVLIVDDEKDIRDSLQLLLEEEVGQVECLTAPSGPVALQIVADRRPDVVLCDYRMPEMDGLAFLGQVQAIHPGTPTIMITAYPDPKLAALAVQRYGVGLFVAKPLDLDYIVALVRAIVVPGASAPRGPREVPTP